MQLERLPALLFSLTLLAGCASPGGSRSSTAAPTHEQDAAALQVKLGQEYMSKGDLETAQEKLQRAVSLNPKSVDAHTLLGILNERINRHEIAERFYRKAVDLKPDDGAVNNNFGAFLCGAGRYAEADQRFQVAINDPFYKTPALAFANAGVCARKSGNLVAAEAYFRRAIEIEPGQLAALYELALISYSRGDYLRARAFIQRYEARGRADAELLQLAVKVETELGDERSAEAYRDRLKHDYPNIDLSSDRTAESP